MPIQPKEAKQSAGLTEVAGAVHAHSGNGQETRECTSLCHPAVCGRCLQRADRPPPPAAPYHAHADLHESIAHGLHQPQQQLRVARGRAAHVLLVPVRSLALSPPLLLQLLQAGLQRLVAFTVQQLLRAANVWAELTLLFRMRPALLAQRAATSAREEGRAEARKTESAHHLHSPRLATPIAQPLPDPRPCGRALLMPA